MKDEMMAKIMDEVMKKMGGTEAPAQSMACEAPQGINEDLCGLTEYVGTNSVYGRFRIYHSLLYSFLCCKPWRIN